jgi:hypothetical protein
MASPCYQNPALLLPAAAAAAAAAAAVGEESAAYIAAVEPAASLKISGCQNDRDVFSLRIHEFLIRYQNKYRGRLTVDCGGIDSDPATGSRVSRPAAARTYPR